MRHFAARMLLISAVITTTTACNSNRVSVSGFPGLAIPATCRAGSTASYSVADGKYPGERAADDLLDGRFLSGINELPLPCIDRRAETYRVFQDNGDMFVVIGMTRATDGSRTWAVWSGGSKTKLRRAERTLLDAEWGRAANEISTINFWEQAARLPPDPYHIRRSEWKIEGYADGRYHRVSRSYDD